MKVAMTSILLLLSLLAGACTGAAQPAAPVSDTGANRQNTAPSQSAGLPPVSDYKVEWVSSQIPTWMKAGEITPIAVTLRNVGNGTWPSSAVSGRSVNNVYVSYHWLPAEDDEVLVLDGLWNWLPKDIAPGETFTLGEMKVQALDRPGDYRLQLSLVHENVTWFEQKGGDTLTVPITIG